MDAAMQPAEMETKTRPAPGARLCGSLLGAEEHLLAALVRKDMASLQPSRLPEEWAARVEAGLAGIASHFMPSQRDLSARLSMHERLNTKLEVISVGSDELWLEAFGSLASGLSSMTGDADLCILGPKLRNVEELLDLDLDPRLDPGMRSVHVKTLDKFAFLLMSHNMVAGSLLRLTHKSIRVPLLKFTEARSGVECDVSVGSRHTILKSLVLGLLGQMEWRFGALVRLVKTWAKAHSLNDASAGSLNSHALTLLVLFVLQTRPVPLLPPLKAIFPGKGDRVNKAALAPADLLSAMDLLRGWRDAVPENTETLSELFLAFFQVTAPLLKLWATGLEQDPLADLYSAVRVSTWEGSLHYLPWTTLSYMVSVEEPFDIDDNAGRSVRDPLIANRIAAVARSAAVILAGQQEFKSADACLEAMFLMRPGELQVILGALPLLSKVQGGTVCCPLVVSAEIYRLLGDRLRRMELGRASSRRGLYAVQWDVPARKANEASTLPPLGCEHGQSLDVLYALCKAHSEEGVRVAAARADAAALEGLIKGVAGLLKRHVKREQKDAKRGAQRRARESRRPAARGQVEGPTPGGTPHREIPTVTPMEVSAGGLDKGVQAAASTTSATAGSIPLAKQVVTRKDPPAPAILAESQPPPPPKTKAKKKKSPPKTAKAQAQSMPAESGPPLPPEKGKPGGATNVKATLPLGNPAKPPTVVGVTPTGSSGPPPASQAAAPRILSAKPPKATKAKPKAALPAGSGAPATPSTSSQAATSANADAHNQPADLAKKTKARKSKKVLAAPGTPGGPAPTLPEPEKKGPAIQLPKAAAAQATVGEEAQKKPGQPQSQASHGKALPKSPAPAQKISSRLPKAMKSVGVAVVNGVLPAQKDVDKVQSHAGLDAEPAGKAQMEWLAQVLPASFSKPTA
ncbi:PAP6 [Auxenochlorella protothecoides x Auxenochlorella symbiontica]